MATANKTIQTRIKWKRDTSANWTSTDPVLLDGEIIIVDTAEGEVRFKIGDGAKKYSQLPFEDEAIRNLINSEISGLRTTISALPTKDTNTAHAHTAGNGITLSGSGGIDGTTTITAKAGTGITVNSTGINNAGVRSITQDSTDGHKLTINTGGTNATITIPDNNTTYTAGKGLKLSGTEFTANTDYTTSGKNYKVAADATSGALYVNVPWTDTKYTLPVGTSSAIGGVKSGGDITIATDGTVSVNDNSHNHNYAGSNSAGGAANAVSIPRVVSNVLELANAQSLNTQYTYFCGGDGTSLGCPENYCILSIQKGDNHRTLIDAYALETQTHYTNGNKSATTNSDNLGVWTGWTKWAKEGFKTITAGGTSIIADTGDDTLTIAAGSNVTITGDATNDKVTIAVSGTDKPTSESTSLFTAGGAYTELNKKANLSSPTFTGTPKAPTAAAGTNSTQLATTAFVTTAVSNLATSDTIVVKEAAHASSADTATNAEHATSADTATNAAHATTADTATNAGYATTAGTASALDTAGQNQVKTIKVNNATAADTATTATTATTANKVSKSLTIGNKTYNGSTAVTITASDLGLSSAMKFIGTTTTTLTDGATTSPIVVNSANHTPTLGDVVIVSGTDQEFVWTGSTWEELGDASSHSVKGHTHNVTHKPAGSVSKPTFTGTEGDISVSYTPSGTVSKPTFSGTQATISSSYTPAGTVSAPTFTGDEATITMSFTPKGTVSKPSFTGSAVDSGVPDTTNVSTVYSITGVGSLPSLDFSAGTLPSASLSKGTLPSASLSDGAVSLTGSVSDRHLTIGISYTKQTLTFSAGSLPSLTWSAGTLPSATFSAGSLPTRSSVSVPNTKHTHSVTAAGSVSQPTFSGTAGTATATYTPDGTISAPTFTGTAGTATATYKPAGSVTQPTFTGTAGTGTGKFTPAGSVSQPTFTGTSVTITTSGSSN